MLTVDVLNIATGRIEPRKMTDEGQGTWSIALSPAPGASALELTVRNEEGKVVLLAEVPVQEGEILTPRVVELEQCVSVQLKDKEFLLHAPKEPERRPPLYRDADLDLVILVDGTALADQNSRPCPLLLQEESTAWKHRIEQLLTFTQALESSLGKSLWVQVMAFGDQPIPTLRARNAAPVYKVYPQEVHERTFRRLHPPTLEKSLKDIPPTPGADPMDALADALEEIAELHWRQNTRKLILLLGQSPGYSISNPPPEDTNPELLNFGVREVSIEEALDRLESMGIECATVFLDLPEALPFFPDAGRKFFRWAQQQYSKLASLPEWAAVASTWQPEDLARTIHNAPHYIVRGFAPGVLKDPT